MELGEYIYRNIEKEPYLIHLYTNLLKVYTTVLFERLKSDELSEKQISDLLKYADLLSKSTNTIKKQFHNNIAQNIVLLLEVILPKNTYIKMIKESVLLNINNYSDNTEKSFYLADIKEFLALEVEKELYRIPIKGEKEYFIRDQREIFISIKNEKVFSFSRFNLNWKNSYNKNIYN